MRSSSSRYWGLVWGLSNTEPFDLGMQKVIWLGLLIYLDFLLRGKRQEFKILLECLTTEYGDTNVRIAFDFVD